MTDHAGERKGPAASVTEWKLLLSHIPMKHYLLSLLLFSLSLVAPAQVINDHSEKEEDLIQGKPGEEDKSALETMIRDRNFPNTGSNAFGRYAEEMLHYRSSMQQLPANWTYVNAPGNLNGDVGRTSTITIDTINSNRFYVCTPHSGVWRTNNNGVSYTPITEALPTQSTHCLVINPLNTNILYLATGSSNSDLPANSMGIYKSTDGGNTWNITGLVFSPSAGIKIHELIFNPKNYNSLLAATSDGLYRTYNSGTTWTKILNTPVHSIRFKPGDTTTVYTTGTLYYRSVNSGGTFTQINTGIRNTFTYYYSHYLRTIASAPNVVYLLTAGAVVNPNFTANFYIHKSTDSGLTFTVIDSITGQVNPQFDVSQSTLDKYVAGYALTWKRNGTSSSLQQATTTVLNAGYPYAHSDQRGISFDPRNDNTIYLCNDGGLYRSTDNGATFQNITANMQLAHLYCLSSSQQINYKILVSPLDVSPYLIGSSGIYKTFTQLVESFASNMSPLNDSIYFVKHFAPLFTQNDWTTNYQSANPIAGNIGAHNFQYSECSENISYFGSYNDIYRSTDYSLTYNVFASTTYNPYNTFNASPKGIAVCRANPDYIYVYYADSVYLTTTGLNPFTNITAGLPVSSAAISSLAVDPANEKHVWVSFSGYSAGNKVFYSPDAGQTWTNISAGMPNIPVSMLVCQQGVPGALYAGTDGGVFYRDNNFSSWQYYNTGLPNVMITGLDIQYTAGKIRASTFGRGVWESNLYQPAPAGYVLPPAAIFTTASTHTCPGEVITFNNASCGVVDSVRWLFPGGSPSTANSYSPAVSYAAPGNYTITLIAYNQGGSDTATKTNYISVAASLPIPYYEPVSDLNQFVLPAGSYVTDVNDDQFSWLRGWWTDGSSGPYDDFICYDNYNHNLYGQEERLVFQPINLTGTAHPKMYFKRSYARQSTTINDTLKVYAKSCGGSEVVVYKKGGAQLANIPGLYPSSFWTPYDPAHWVRDSIDLLAFSGQPSVTISFANKGYGGQLLYIDEFLLQDPNGATGVQEAGQAGISVFPNPANDQLHISSQSTMLNELFITDVLGRCVLRERSAANDATLNISAFAKGVYFLHVNGTVFRVQKQ